jgi:phosphatidylglycerol:prolipoprotein diacylglycerol transferase
MYPTLPLGPLSLPTAPFVILLAATFGLEMAGRYGRRTGLHADDVWNTGLLAILAGLVVARLWNVLQFWPIYLDEPLLLLSLRPSGFVWWPGVVAALVAAYWNLWRRALSPLRVIAAFAVGGVAASIIWRAGAYLTGELIGTRSELPWALPYFGELRHPVALYQAFGLWLLFVILWLNSRRMTPARTILLAGFGYSVVQLIGDAFVDGAPTVAGLRLTQIVALAAALTCSGLLARSTNQSAPPAPTEVEQPATPG